MREEFDNFLKRHRADVEKITINGYRGELRQFDEWLTENDLEPLDVSRGDLKIYIGYLKDQHDYSPKTLRKKFAVLKSFYGDAVEEGNISGNPTETIELSDVANRQTKTEIKARDKRVFLTEDEVQKLVDNVASPKLRNRLIILFQYQTGLRRNEVAKTKLDDLEWSEQRVKVIGKGDKVVKAYWQPSLDPLLDAWVNGGYRDSSPFSDDSEYLFLSNYGGSINGHTVNRVVKVAAERAGMQEILFQDTDGNKFRKITSHVLRHSFGANWIKRGGSTAVLQQILAHADSETTEVYKDMVDDWVQEEARRVGVGADIEIDESVDYEECARCGKQANLVDHHISYQPEKLIEVCVNCHAEIHGNKDDDWLPDRSREWAMEQGLLD